jgi:hypothetical protein
MRRTRLAVSVLSLEPPSRWHLGHPLLHRANGHLPRLVRVRDLSCKRRRVVHFNITSTPSAAWTPQQIGNAFPDESATMLLTRDRDGFYGIVFRDHVVSERTI